MLAARADEVAAAFARHGLRERARRVRGEWAAVRAGAGVIRLAVRVARADAEAVLAELLELAPGGLEEREVGEDAVEYVIYGAPGELPALPDVRAAAGGALVDVSTSEVPDDWSERWKAFHRPGRRELALPPAARAPAVGGAARGDGIDLVIDPGQAFGTGAHHTTRLCLELLLELEPGRRARRLGLRHGRARDRRRAARLGPRAGVRLGGGLGRGDARERGRQRRAGDRGRARWTCAAPRGRGRRRSSPTSSARCCSRSRG